MKIKRHWAFNSALITSVVGSDQVLLQELLWDLQDEGAVLSFKLRIHLRITYCTKERSQRDGSTRLCNSILMYIFPSPTIGNLPEKYW